MVSVSFGTLDRDFLVACRHHALHTCLHTSTQLLCYFLSFLCLLYCVYSLHLCIVYYFLPALPCVPLLSVFTALPYTYTTAVDPYYTTFLFSSHIYTLYTHTHNFWDYDLTASPSHTPHPHTHHHLTGWWRFCFTRSQVGRRRRWSRNFGGGGRGTFTTCKLLPIQVGQGGAGVHTCMTFFIINTFYLLLHTALPAFSFPFITHTSPHPLFYPIWIPVQKHLKHAGGNTYPTVRGKRSRVIQCLLTFLSIHEIDSSLSLVSPLTPSLPLTVLTSWKTFRERQTWLGDGLRLGRGKRHHFTFPLFSSLTLSSHLFSSVSCT